MFEGAASLLATLDESGVAFCSRFVLLCVAPPPPLAGQRTVAASVKFSHGKIGVAETSVGHLTFIVAIFSWGKSLTKNTGDSEPSECDSFTLQMQVSAMVDEGCRRLGVQKAHLPTSEFLTLCLRVSSDTTNQPALFSQGNTGKDAFSAQSDRVCSSALEVQHLPEVSCKRHTFLPQTWA